MPSQALPLSPWVTAPLLLPLSLQFNSVWCQSLSLGSPLDLVCSALTSPCGFNLHFHEQPARLNRARISRSEPAAPANLTVPCSEQFNNLLFILLLLYWSSFLWLSAFKVLLSGAVSCSWLLSLSIFSQCSSFERPLQFSWTGPGLVRLEDVQVEILEFIKPLSQMAGSYPKSQWNVKIRDLRVFPGNEAAMRTRG